MKGYDPIPDKSQQDDSIEIVDYNPDWVALAQQEIELIISQLSHWHWLIDIQHIGSTAVPGLAAKPIIDIYLGVSSVKDAQAAIVPLEKLGYVFWKDNPNPEKMFFVKGMPPFGKGRTHHVHIVKYDSDYWRARILFRDFLRRHKEEVKAYAALKYKLMEEFGEDREAYTDAKFDYISSILKKAGFKEAVRR